jgi:hypothetical protein
MPGRLTSVDGMRQRTYLVPPLSLITWMITTSAARGISPGSWVSRVSLGQLGH